MNRRHVLFGLGLAFPIAASAEQPEQPDVVFNVVLLKDGHCVASPTVVGQFGREVKVEIGNTLRVAAVAFAPNAQGWSATKVRTAVFDGDQWLPSKEMADDLDLSKTPSFVYSPPGTTYRFVIMPRRVVAGAGKG